MRKLGCILLALLFLCSCATAPKTGRVSEEELAKLREAYPYYDALNPMALYSAEALARNEDPYAMLPHWKEIRSCALVEIEITSEPYYTLYWSGPPEMIPEEYQSRRFWKPFRDFEDFMSQHPELDEEIARMLTVHTSCYLDATVSQIIWGNCGLRKGSNFKLLLGTFMEPDTLDAFTRSGKMVCVLSSYDAASDFLYLPLKKVYQTTKAFSWHLTEEDVVLSVSSNYGADSFSGLYLESFKQEVLAVLEENNK